MGLGIQSSYSVINIHMKINEVTQMSDQALFESIDRTNDSGIATSDLVKVVRAQESDQWSDPMSADEFLAKMANWRRESSQ